MSLPSVRHQVLITALPSRWGFFQRLKNTLIYVLIVSALCALRLMPFRVTQICLRGAGFLGFFLARQERHRALEHLALAFPDLADPDRQQIARDMFVHFGESGAELVHTTELLERTVLSAEVRRIVDEALALGRGMIAVTGHIGNWELLAQVFAKAGYPIATVAKPLYDPRLTRLVHQERSRHGMQVLWRGDDTSAKDILRVLKNRGVLALLIDQDTKVQGIFVPFFGRLAFTPVAPATLALRFDAPVIVFWMHRTSAGQTIHAQRVPVEHTGDNDADILALTSDLNARLEHAIRQCPAQWVWMHKRWKRRPEVILKTGFTL